LELAFLPGKLFSSRHHCGLGGVCGNARAAAVAAAVAVTVVVTGAMGDCGVVDVGTGGDTKVGEAAAADRVMNVASLFGVWLAVVGTVFPDARGVIVIAWADAGLSSSTTVAGGTTTVGGGGGGIGVSADAVGWASAGVAGAEAPAAGDDKTIAVAALRVAAAGVATGVVALDRAATSSSGMVVASTITG
jgi:hypothetical protein